MSLVGTKCIIDTPKIISELENGSSVRKGFDFVVQLIMSKNGFAGKSANNNIF